MNNNEIKTVTLNLLDEQASKSFAARLGLCLKDHLEVSSNTNSSENNSSKVITFSGDLGSGKTTIIRGMLKELGIESAIKSPTFSLVESYACFNVQVHHFDLYRIAHEEELEYLGFRDYFTFDSICCIEWPENAGKELPYVDLQFELNFKGSGRVMRAIALSSIGEKILVRLEGDT